MKERIFTPSRTLVIGFLIIILIGTILLTLPNTTVDGKGLPFLNALFTATSATCVTGLVVVDTGTTFTTFGQVIILILIQIGGLGFMTFTTFFAILLGKKVSLKERLFLQEALNQSSLQGVVRLAKYVLVVALLIETVGAVILSSHFIPDMGWQRGTYYGIFHSISAFNNAGFDLFGGYTSLTSRVGDIGINLTIAALFILGGLGFAVLVELYTTKANFRRLSLHAKCVLLTTLALIISGTLLIYLLESQNSLAELNFGSKLLASFFQSVSPRTAGFNTVNLPDMHVTTLLLIILFMFIGASSGSTGGGIKTTTFASIILSVFSTFKGNEQITFRERAIPQSLIKKAIALTFVSTILVLVVTSILTLTEDTDLLTALFEATSAFGTVGLTLGITPTLSSIGKLAIIVTMFAGRIGPLTLVFALAKLHEKTQNAIKYPEGKIVIG